MKKQLYLILLTLVTWSCENKDNPFPNLTMGEREIVEKAYSENYTYPEGFNFQQDHDGAIYYENTVSIRTSETSWIELNSNDKQQAKEWSEISSSTSAYYRDLVEERVTEKYFEFKRAYSVNPNDVILSRVHKSAYFIPSYDKFRPTQVIGTLKVDPIDKQKTKDFIEYMWTSQMIGHTGKVLEYSVTDYSDKVQYNLISVHVTYGDFGLCDIIEVKNFDFFIDKQSGTVSFESNKIKEIKGACR
jgi:Mg2+ and Co2+ transporter CorA